MNTYGERLKKARNMKKMSRQHLAELCGISSKTIQNYESGKISPNRIDVSQKFAEALGVTVDYLINGESDKSEPTKADIEAILAQTSALFAGGKLSQHEQLQFINELQTIYLDAMNRSGNQ